MYSCRYRRSYTLATPSLKRNCIGSLPIVGFTIHDYTRRRRLTEAARLLFLDEIIWGLGASEVLFPYCRDYLIVQLYFAVFNIMQVSLPTGRSAKKLFQWCIGDGKLVFGCCNDISVQCNDDEAARWGRRSCDYGAHLFAVPFNNSLYRFFYGNSSHHKL